MTKILLISPRTETTATYGYPERFQFLPGSPIKKRLIFSLTLPTIAALTPPDYDVTVVHEVAEEPNLDESYDIVGLTGTRQQIPRAREIAEAYRRRWGSLIVCGGPSVTFSPDEWRPFADVLFFGEGERTWPRFLADYRTGTYSNEYREQGRVDLAQAPAPDLGAVSKRYLEQCFAGMVQTTRGCPYSCEFCSSAAIVGREIRHKRIDVVMQELEQFRRNKINVTIIVDENLFADKPYARRLLREIRRWNRRHRPGMSFVVPAPIEIARDDELLELAVECGVQRMQIGIETVNEASLRETHKYHNLRSNMLDDIRRVHEYGIMVQSSCLVGFDHDDISIFRKQYEFFTKAGIVYVGVYPVQALPGSPLRERLIRENRLIQLSIEEVSSKNFSRFRSFTFVPKLMTADQFQQGCQWLVKKFFDWDAVRERYRTFLEHFERSPKKHRLKFAKLRPGVDELRLSARLMRYIMTQAPRDERQIFFKMLGDARRSSHPHAFALAVGTFMVIKDQIDKMNVEIPGFQETEYPR